MKERSWPSDKPPAQSILLRRVIVLGNSPCLLKRKTKLCSYCLWAFSQGCAICSSVMKQQTRLNANRTIGVDRISQATGFKSASRRFVIEQHPPGLVASN